MTVSLVHQRKITKFTFKSMSLHYLQDFTVNIRVISNCFSNWSVKEFVNQYKPSQVLSTEEFAELKNSVESSKTESSEPLDEEVRA